MRFDDVVHLVVTVVEDEEDEDLLKMDKIDTWIDWLIELFVPIDRLMVVVLLLLVVVVVVHCNNYQY